MIRPSHDFADGQEGQPPRMGDSPARGHGTVRPQLPSLLFAEPLAAGAGEQGEDRSFAADMNLDQIVAAIAGDREERDLITGVLFGHLRDAGAVRYRQEVFQDLDDPALFEAARRFAGLMREVRAHLRQLAQMHCRYRLGGWLDEDQALAPAAAATPPDGEADLNRRAQGNEIVALTPDEPGTS